MKIFLSWLGPRSRAVAEALNDWLRRVIQAVKPFYSPEIEKGAKWGSEIDDALAGTHFGIVCLTPDNLKSTWIHFETGALSKTKDALIWTFLHGLTPGDVPPPLGKFQHTVAKKGDTLSLLKTINDRLGEVGGEPLSEKLLEENFETFWPQLESKLQAAEKLSDPASSDESKPSVGMQRDERAILNEILELVRNQERRLSGLESHVLSFPRADVSSQRDKLRLCRDVRIRIPVKDDSETGDPTETIARAIIELSPESEIHRIAEDDQGYLLSVSFRPAIAEHVLERLVAATAPPGTRFKIQKTIIRRTE